MPTTRSSRPLPPFTPSTHAHAKSLEDPLLGVVYPRNNYYSRLTGPFMNSLNNNCDGDSLWLNLPPSIFMSGIRKRSRKA